MKDDLKLARPYLVLLAIATVGRWLQGNVFHTPYPKGTHVFSIVTLTIYASIFYGVFLRRFLGYRVVQVLALTALMGVASQVVVVVSTLVSYGLGIDSYFNHPTALNLAERVGFAQAMGIRAAGFLVNTLLSAVAGGLGWVVGAALPAK
jgi:hypothetical protein